MLYWVIFYFLFFIFYCLLFIVYYYMNFFCNHIVLLLYDCDPILLCTVSFFAKPKPFYIYDK
jgi:hypothetical protein